VTFSPLPTCDTSNRRRRMVSCGLFFFCSITRCDRTYDGGELGVVCGEGRRERRHRHCQTAKIVESAQARRESAVMNAPRDCEHVQEYDVCMMVRIG
jgi:hypothetical protein